MNTKDFIQRMHNYQAQDRIENVLETEREDIPDFRFNYMVKINKNGKDVLYFDDCGQKGCLSEFEKTEDGLTRYQVFLHNHLEDGGGYFYLLSRPTNHKIDDFKTWWVISGLGEPRPVDKKVIEHLLDNKDKCAEIIDIAKRMNAEIFDFSYREESNYRDNEPWTSIDDAIEIEEKHKAK